MRLFRKKSDSPAHQEYLDGLINSIRQARREEEEKPGLHAFVEEDSFPIPDDSKPARVPPGIAGAAPDPDSPGADANEIANLEAYLSKLDAEPPTLDESEGEGRVQSG